MTTPDDDRSPVELPPAMSRETLYALLDIWAAAAQVMPSHCHEYADLLRATALDGLDSVEPLTDDTPMTGRHWSSTLMARVAEVLDSVGDDVERLLPS